jgi:hypothetical protein
MLPSGTANWFTFITPTPAAQNQLRAESVEFYNPSQVAIPLSGLFLLNSADLADKVALSGSVAPRSWTTPSVTAHARRDFQSFDAPTLPPLLTAQSAMVRAGDYGQAWHSTQDDPGRLLLQLPESQAAPLSTTGTDLNKSLHHQLVHILNGSVGRGRGHVFS